MQSAIAGRSLWEAFRASKLWIALRAVRPLREVVHFAIELQLMRRDWGADPANWERLFAGQRDPWNFETTEFERARLRRMAELAEPPAGASPWPRALEIGCAEGAFSALLAPHCKQLICTDMSPTALERARARQSWSSNVDFMISDIRREVLPGAFDLIVAACILEYIVSPREMRRVRDRIVSELNPEGHLLVVSTRHSEVVESTWWGKLLVRGRWINTLFEEHADLEVISSEVSATQAFTLLRKRCG